MLWHTILKFYAVQIIRQFAYFIIPKSDHCVHKNSHFAQLNSAYLFKIRFSTPVCRRLSKGGGVCSPCTFISPLSVLQCWTIPQPCWSVHFITNSWWWRGLHITNLFIIRQFSSLATFPALSRGNPPSLQGSWYMRHEVWRPLKAGCEVTVQCFAIKF